MPSTPNTTPARPRAHSAILVTGATGQVGRRLVPRLLGWREPDEHVRVLVRTQEAADRFAALGADAVVGDLRETEDRSQSDLIEVVHRVPRKGRAQGRQARVGGVGRAEEQGARSDDLSDSDVIGQHLVGPGERPVAPVR